MDRSLVETIRKIYYITQSGYSTEESWDSELQSHFNYLYVGGCLFTFKKQEIDSHGSHLLLISIS